jgi:hypothetical protein
LPSALKVGKVRGFVANCGFQLDIFWRKGNLERVYVRSSAGMPQHFITFNKLFKVASVSEGGQFMFEGNLKPKA